MGRFDDHHHYYLLLLRSDVSSSSCYRLSDLLDSNSHANCYYHGSYPCCCCCCCCSFSKCSHHSSLDATEAWLEDCLSLHSLLDVRLCCTIISFIQSCNLLSSSFQESTANHRKSNQLGYMQYSSLSPWSLWIVSFGGGKSWRACTAPKV